MCNQQHQNQELPVSTWPAEEISVQNNSKDDILIKAFGYDPSKDTFENVTTVFPLPVHLSDVDVSNISRRDVTFYKNDEDEFEIISSGASFVYHASRDGTDVIVKDYSHSSRPSEETLREASILSLLEATSVVPGYQGVMEQGVVTRDYCIVQEKCPGFVTLADFLKSSSYISKSSWISLCLNLSRALKILHSHKVLHNNIRPENILVDKENLDVKFVGFSQASYGTGVYLSSDIHNSFGQSPEVKLGCITSPESDVFALASVLQLLMTESRVMSLYEVIHKTHQDLPKDRPGAEEIFRMITDISDTLKK